MNLLNNIFLCFSCFALIAAAPIDDENNYIRVTPDEFNETIEYVRSIIKHGLPSANIPVLDPLSVEHLPIKFDIPMAKADLVLDDVLSQGLSSFVAYKVEINPDTLQLNLGIYLDSLKAYFLYDGSMTIFEFIPIFGKGNAYVRFDGYVVDIAITFKKTEDGKYLKCDQVTMNFKLDSCDFQISGLLNNEDASKLISQFITDMVPTFIKDHEKWMNATYSPILATVLDKINIEVDAIFA